MHVKEFGELHAAIQSATTRYLVDLQRSLDKESATHIEPDVQQIIGRRLSDLRFEASVKVTLTHGDAMCDCVNDNRLVASSLTIRLQLGFFRPHLLVRFCAGST
jgi:hypothetical protein